MNENKKNWFLNYPYWEKKLVINKLKILKDNKDLEKKTHGKNTKYFFWCLEEIGNLENWLFYYEKNENEKRK